MTSHTTLMVGESAPSHVSLGRNGGEIAETMTTTCTFRPSAQRDCTGGAGRAPFCSLLQAVDHHGSMIDSLFPNKVGHQKHFPAAAHPWKSGPTPGESELGGLPSRVCVNLKSSKSMPPAEERSNKASDEAEKGKTKFAAYLSASFISLGQWSSGGGRLFGCSRAPAGAWEI